MEMVILTWKQFSKFKTKTFLENSEEKEKKKSTYI